MVFKILLESCNLSDSFLPQTSETPPSIFLMEIHDGHSILLSTCLGQGD